MNIYLSKVNLEEKEILYRLLQYSLFEESATDFNEITAEGVFEYRWFDNYFTDDDRIAFFVKENDTEKLIGFVMINKYMQKSNEGHSIAEFMILPKYRRKGIGKKVAIECFSKYPGNWEVSPSYGSKNAYLFWKHVICDYTRDKYEFVDGVFIFTLDN